GVDEDAQLSTRRSRAHSVIGLLGNESDAGRIELRGRARSGARPPKAQWIKAQGLADFEFDVFGELVDRSVVDRRGRTIRRPVFALGLATACGGACACT